MASLVTALTISSSAALCIKLLPRAHPRIRYVISVIGLCAWMIPWGWIRLPLEAPGTGLLDQWLPSFGADAALPSAVLDQFRQLALVPDVYLLIAFAGFSLIGLAWFIADCIRARRSLERWRAQSRRAEHLRERLPEHLRAAPTEIRLIPGTRVAAASGWFSTTIWIGDQFRSDEEMRLALLHEGWHIRNADPIWTALIIAARRFYWWNPVVAHLTAQALHFLECCCDFRCTESFGRQRYIEKLASMVHDGNPSRTARLLASLRGRNRSVQRLALLSAATGIRFRDVASIAPLLAAATILVAYQLADRQQSLPAWSTVRIPSTPAGESSEVPLSAINSDDMDVLNIYLGAYTPQEISMRIDGWRGAVQLVDVVKSEPLSIPASAPPGARVRGAKVDI